MTNLDRLTRIAEEAAKVRAEVDALCGYAGFEARPTSVLALLTPPQEEE